MDYFRLFDVKVSKGIAGSGLFCLFLLTANKPAFKEILKFWNNATTALYSLGPTH
jgi:hypothetical protein